MKHLFFSSAVGGLVVLATACATTYPLGPPPRGWPAWAEELTSRLECGMAVAEVQEIAGSELDRLGGPAVLGTHGVRHRAEPGSVLFVFEEGRLESFMMTKPVPRMTSLRTSPRRNLCTGEWMFLLKLGHLYFSDGTKSYLDGVLLKTEDQMHGVLVGAGEHELRIEMSHRTVLLPLDLRPEKDDGILYFDDPVKDGERHRI